MDSADPHTDSLFLRQMRSEMARIRSTQHRPTVGLVLSGGGAKGAAQVGALMFLEEMGIPVDLICGTSIGGLVGGMYALGYSAADMKEIFETQDWDIMLTDIIDPSYIPYTTKMYNTRYLLTIPFLTAEDVFETGRSDRRKSFSNSLPSGIANGFNVNNLISSLTVGYQDSLSFKNFPTPFMCVASDMISCKAKNWGSGYLNTALRSTMSIPGLFNPVRTSGMVLVDGGTRNNFPTDVAKAMGADYIIGIELSDSKPGYDEVNNIGDIVWQFFTMLSNDAYDKNVNIPDVFIKPDLEGYNMLSFSREAVDTMITRGYEAAKARKAEILQLKRKIGNHGGRSTHEKATDLSKERVRIGSISFDGLTDAESRMMYKLLDFSPGDTVGKKDMDHIMSKLHATGAFSAVTYSLLGTEEPYSLVFHCVTSPTNNIGIGFRLDSEEWASLLIYLGLNDNSLMGSRFGLTAKLGQNLKADLHYALDLPWMPTINLDASISRYKGNLGTPGDDQRFDVTYWTHKEMLYLTDVRWTRINFKAGIRNQYVNLNENSYLASEIVRGFSKDALRGDYVGAFASGNYYTFDNYYYPSSGSNLAFICNYDFAKAGVPSFSPVVTLGLDFKKVFPIRDKFAILPDLHLRNVINTGEKAASDGHMYKDLSVLHTNFIGGAIGGRYTENQVPFFGVNNVLTADEYLCSASIEFRYNPVKKFFLSGMAGLFESGDNIGSLVTDFNPDCWAVGLEAAYDFIGGPVKLNLHWSNLLKWGLYVSVGFDF